ncbi:hypothetical protein ACFQL4_19910 [Halosimplex aquaticum]
MPAGRPRRRDADPRESTCASGDTGTRALYDDWLLRLRPGDYDAPTVAFVSARPRFLTPHSALYRGLRPYLWYSRELAEAAAMPFPDLDRVTALRPPSERPALYVVFDYSEERWRWLTRLQGTGFRSAELTKASDYRGFQRRGVSDNKVNAVAFDEEYVVVAPKAADPVAADAGGASSDSSTPPGPTPTPATATRRPTVRSSNASPRRTSSSRAFAPTAGPSPGVPGRPTVPVRADSR